MNRYRSLLCAIVLCAASGSTMAHGYERSVKVTDAPLRVEIDGSSFDVNSVRDESLTAEIRQLNHMLKLVGIELTVSSCDVMLSITVPVAFGNVSYGGYCDLSGLRKDAKLMICTDESVGYLSMAIIPEPRELSDERLTTFIALNCFGG